MCGLSIGSLRYNEAPIKVYTLYNPFYNRLYNPVVQRL